MLFAKERKRDDEGIWKLFEIVFFKILKKNLFNIFLLYLNPFNILI